MKKIIKKIKDTLVYKLAVANKRIKYLEKKLADEVVEKQQLIDEVEPLRIKIRELTLKVQDDVER